MEKHIFCSEEKRNMEAQVQQVAAWLADNKATHITVLDIHEVSSMAEFLILATANSARHAQALAQDVAEKLREKNWEYFGVEGMERGQWVLVDCNSIIVHIFQEEFRSLYNLEGLFSKARVVALPENPCEVSA